MNQDSPLRAGFALAITVGMFYALCALVWALAPATHQHSSVTALAARAS